MVLGPGKYDLATRVRTEAEAEAVIVLRGSKGSGFSCQVDSERPELLSNQLV